MEWSNLSPLNHVWCAIKTSYVTFAAGRVHNGFTEFRINAIHHKASDGAWSIEFARIARRLQIFKDLFVNITKQMAFAGAGKVNFVQLVDHLTQ